MKVIAAKTITRPARKWLEERGTIIERHHGLWIVFLPETLVMHSTWDSRDPAPIRERDWKKQPRELQSRHLLIESKPDEKHTIYTAWEPGT